MAAAATAVHASNLTYRLGPSYPPTTTTYRYEGAASGATHITDDGMVVGDSYIITSNFPPPYGDYGRAQRWAADGSQSLSMQLLSSNATFENDSRVRGINPSGISTGYSTRAAADGSYHGRLAVRWNEAGQVEPLGTLGLNTAGTQLPLAGGNAINASGTVVGFEYRNSGSSPNERPMPVRWDAGQTTPALLPQLMATGGWGEASAINDSGLIAGASGRPGTFRYQAVVWIPGSSAPTPIGPSDTSIDSFSKLVTNSGIVIGQSVSRGFRWTAKGGYSELLPLNYQGPGDPNTSYVYSANEAGTAVGYSWSPGQPQRALRWDPQTTTPVNISGSNAAAAWDINNLGAIVGTYYLSGGGAVLWLPGETTPVMLRTQIDPNSEWYPVSAASISDTGFVTGNAVRSDGASGARLFSMLVPQAGTYGRGDANFDTKIDFDDLLILAQHYGSANVSQDIHVGDLNLDGSVNFDDLLTLAQHYESSSAIVEAGVFDQSFAGDWALARSLVPEPAACVVLAAGMIARRRR